MSSENPTEVSGNTTVIPSGNMFSEVSGNWYSEAVESTAEPTSETPTCHSQLECFGEQTGIQITFGVLEAIFLVLGTLLLGSLVYSCFQMLLKNIERKTKHGRVINHLTLMMFLILLTSWIFQIPILFITTVSTSSWPSRKALCQTYDFLKVAVYYLLNYTYLGNTIMRFLYNWKIAFAIKVESKGPTGYWIGGSLIVAMLLGIKRCIFPSASVRICYELIEYGVRVGDPQPRLLKLTPILFGIVPLIINAILNIFIVILTRRRENQVDVTKNDEQKQRRKMKTWTSANLHFVCVGLYAWVVITSLAKKYIRSLRKIQYDLDNGYIMFIASDLHLMIIVGIIAPALCLCYSPPIKKRVMAIWKKSKIEHQESTMSESKQSAVETPPARMRFQSIALNSDSDELQTVNKTSNSQQQESDDKQ